MADLIPLLNKEDIEKMVADVAQKISHDYKNSELVLIGVLKGAFVFMAEKSLFLLKLIFSVFPAMVQILFHLEK